METKATTIIYNKFNHDSVIAAAILKTELPGSVAIDMSKLVNDESTTYIWLGVTPPNRPGDHNDTMKDKEHIVIGEKQMVTYRKPSFFDRFRKVVVVSILDVEDEEECVSEYTLIHAVCDKFEFISESYRKLAFHVAHFHLKKTELEYLTYVYINLQRAEKCLNGGDYFQVKEVGDADMDKYIDDIKDAKKLLNNNYQHKLVKDGQRVRSAFYTTLDGFGYHLVLRLIKLVHHNYMNGAMGMYGPIVYTNLKHMVMDEKADPCLILN